MESNRKIVFFDALPRGHHGEFLENIICGIEDRDVAIHILAHPELRDRLQAAVDLWPSKNVTLHDLSAGDVEAFSAAKSVIARGQAELKVVQSFCEDHEITRIVLMHMNVHQWALRTSLKDNKYSIRGIMLSPYIPLSRVVGWRAQSRAAFSNFRKHLQYRLMLKNNQIDRVFFLNDQRVADELNRRHPERQVFYSIPDPIPAMALNAEAVLPEAADKNRFTFLILGALGPRKGILLALKAMAGMPPELLRKVALRIVGKIADKKDSYWDEVEHQVARLKAIEAGVRVSMVDRFVDFREMNGEIMHCDCLLAVYPGFYGSSGMLGHAARYGKPLIVSVEGLMGELATKHRIGHAIDARSPSQLASAMIAICENQHESYEENQASFAESIRAESSMRRLYCDW